MATLTSNGSFSSLSISGSGTKSGNITFTPPTLPDGATIISTSLTAYLDISMRLGSAKVTINGDTYSSSTSLSINLGTSLISSLSVSAKGSSFLARGTVSITNIVYTVNYVVKHTITASAGSGGSISESGEIKVDDGVTKTFTFTPNEGYKISDVLVDGVSVGAVSSYTFSNITENHTVSVSFSIITYTISASAGIGGSISPSGNVSANYGSSKTFSISPNSGYKIDNVIVDGISVGSVNSYTFSNITENHTINAIFRQVYTIDVSCGENGSISESGSIEVEPNSSKTFTFTPNDGYMVDTVIVDGTDIGRVNNYTFENITSNHTLSISFIIASYSVYVIDNTNKDGIKAYPTEKQINYDENVDIIVTTPQNTNISAKENGNDITLNKFNNEVFTFDNQTITDGFGKGIMYHIGNPTIYTDNNGNKMLYMDGNSALKIDVSYYANSDLTISFDFMLTNLNDTDEINIFQIPYVSDTFIFEHFRMYSEGYKLWYCYASNVMDAHITLENNTWYNVALCRKDNTNYFFVNGKLIYSFSFTTKYEILNIFSKIYSSSGTDKYIEKCCIGYLKNIVVCNSCLHTQNYQVSDELLIESDFTGEYSVYNCTDETTLNVPYINNNLLKFEVLGTVKHINGKFYSNDRSLYLDFKGIKLTPNISTESFTISFWYEPTLIANKSYTDECTLIYAKGKDINSNTCAISMSSNIYNIALVKYENNSTKTKYTDQTFEIGNKYYISFESDGLNYYLYINGELVSSYALSNQMSLDYIIIGSNNSKVMYNKGYFGNINFVNDVISKGQDFSIYPINYPIENIYGYTATLSSPNDIIIELLSKIIPVLSINNITRNKISSISGYDTSVAEFTSDTDLTEWEARATVEGQPYGHGIGALVDSGTTLLANETATVTIDDEELTNGDVEYRISVYGKDANGVWSDE